MCSISGFSFTPCSQFDARKVATAMLTEGRSRGTDAAGYGYLDDDNAIHVSTQAGDPKRFVSSRAFALPASARSVVLHTRLATQGLPSNPRNNHPVYRFTQDAACVAAVHNGCISNDFALFRDYQIGAVAQVDSEIIPALLAKAAPGAYEQAFAAISGSMATAWLDERTPGTLHLARAYSSPVHFAYVETEQATGLIFASTEKMLRAGLRAMGLHLTSPGVTWYTLNEGQYLAVHNGEWEGTADTFTFPRPAYVRDWRSGSKATPRQTTSKPGTGKPERSQREPMGEWGWWDRVRAEGRSASAWDGQAWGTDDSCFDTRNEKYNADNSDAPGEIIEGEFIGESDAEFIDAILDDYDPTEADYTDALSRIDRGDADEFDHAIVEKWARQAKDADRCLHRLYCEPRYCALDDEGHCPEYWADVDSSKLPSAAAGTPADHYTDTEVNIMAARLFIEAGLG